MDEEPYAVIDDISFNFLEWIYSKRVLEWKTAKSKNYILLLGFHPGICLPLCKTKKFFEKSLLDNFKTCRSS